MTSTGLAKRNAERGGGIYRSYTLLMLSERLQILGWKCRTQGEVGNKYWNHKQGL